MSVVQDLEEKNSPFSPASFKSGVNPPSKISKSFSALFF